MADYSQTLSEPSGDFAHGVSATPGWGNAIGGVLSGAADIFSVGLKMRDEDHLKSENLDLTNKLNTYIQANAQGKMTRDEMLARSSGDLVSAINRVPRFADDLRKTAQNNLGLNPQAAQVTDADWKVQAGRQMKLGLATDANNKGIIFVDKNGNPDIEKMYQAGQTIAQDKAKQDDLDKSLERQYKQAQIDKEKAGTPLTDSERQDMEFKALHSATTATYNQFVDSAFSRYDAYKKSLKDMPEERARQGLLEGINRDRLNFRQWFTGVKNSTNLSAKTYKDMDELYSGFYDNLGEIANGKNSDFQTSMDTFKLLQTNHQLDAEQLASDFMRLRAVLGDPGLAAVVPNAVNTNAPLMQRLGNEIKTLTNISSGAAGTYDVGKEQDPTTQKSVVDKQINLLDDINSRVNTWNDKDPTVYANTSAQVIRLALQGNDPDQMFNAQQRLASPESMQSLKKLASDPAHAAQAQVIGQGMYALNRQSIIMNAQRLGPEVNPVSAVGAAISQAGADMSSAESGYVQPSRVTADVYKPVYNPNSGKIELITSGTGIGGGKDIPASAKAKVAALNQSLDNMIRLKEYGSDQEKALKDSQLKYFVISNTGLPLRDGTDRPEMPGDKKVEGNAVKFTKMASAVQKVESNNDPNAVSSRGAKGAMQTMPNTLVNPGFGVKPAQDDSPAEMARVGRDYLAAMDNKYKNPTLALAAYNWGPTNVDAWVKRGAKPSELPQETKDYIIKVMQERFK